MLLTRGKGEAWKWRHWLLAWEEKQSGECYEWLNNFIIQVGVDDRCRWHLDPDKGYSSSCVYHMPTKMGSVVQAVANDIIWNKTVSLRVSLYVWWLLCNCLSIKDNSAKHGIIHNNVLCVRGYRKEETIDHLY